MTVLVALTTQTRWILLLQRGCHPASTVGHPCIIVELRPKPGCFVDRYLGNGQLARRQSVIVRQPGTSSGKPVPPRAPPDGSCGQSTLAPCCWRFSSCSMTWTWWSLQCEENGGKRGPSIIGHCPGTLPSHVKRPRLLFRPTILDRQE